MPFAEAQDRLGAPDGAGNLGDEHEHASLLVRIFGDKLDFASPAYQIKSSWIHFEDSDGTTIHRHSSGITLGYLFDGIGFVVNDECFIMPNGNKFCTNEDYSLKYYINHQRVNFTHFPSYYVIEEGDRILITFGNETPEQIEEQLLELDSQIIKDGSRELDSVESFDPTITTVEYYQELVNLQYAMMQAEQEAEQQAQMEANDGEGGGCLIATAAYGSELTDEVQNLREIRNKMYETETGGELMKSVNEFYYSFSPTVSDWERENPILRESVKLLITPAMISFTVLDHEGINSDQDLINYVVSITFLNIGMYFVAPAVLIMKIRKRI